MSEVFEGSVESYSAVSFDARSVSVSVNGSVLSISGLAAGDKTVEATASNSAGSASIRIGVVVLDSTSPPVYLCCFESGHDTWVGGPAIEVDAAPQFRGVIDSWSVSAIPPAAVSASITGTTVKVTPRAAGYSYVRVTASNSAGSTSNCTPPADDEDGG